MPVICKHNDTIPWNIDWIPSKKLITHDHSCLVVVCAVPNSADDDDVSDVESGTSGSDLMTRYNDIMQ